MKFEAYQNIEFERRGRVLVIKLNRPGPMNAINGALHTELARVFIDAANDADSDVVVLTGNGRAFCAGGDIDWMQRSIDQPAEFEIVAAEAKTIVFSLLDLAKPLVCRLNGHAMGLGATLAVCCDIVVAHSGVKIADPHVNVGLVAGDGGALLWPQLIGYAKARRYLLTGDALTATEAERIGLVSEVVAPDQLDEASYGLAERLARGATKAIRWTKITTNLPLKQLVHSHFDAGVAYEMLSNLSSDHREAVAAFRERRDALFTGG
jgi:enoyl-CoA hydratase